MSDNASSAIPLSDGGNLPLTTKTLSVLQIEDVRGAHLCAKQGFYKVTVVESVLSAQKVILSSDSHDIESFHLILIDINMEKAGADVGKIKWYAPDNAALFGPLLALPFLTYPCTVRAFEAYSSYWETKSVAKNGYLNVAMSMLFSRMDDDEIALSKTNEALRMLRKEMSGNGRERTKEARTPGDRRAKKVQASTTPNAALNRGVQSLREQIKCRAKRGRVELFDVKFTRERLKKIACEGDWSLPLEDDHGRLAITIRKGNLWESIEIASLFLDMFMPCRDDSESKRQVLKRVDDVLAKWEKRSQALGPYATAVRALECIETSWTTIRRDKCVQNAKCTLDAASGEAQQTTAHNEFNTAIEAAEKKRKDGGFLVYAGDICDKTVRRLVVCFAVVNAHCRSRRSPDRVEVHPLVGISPAYSNGAVKWSRIVDRVGFPNNGNQWETWVLSVSEKHACQLYASYVLEWKNSVGRPWPEWILVSPVDYLREARIAVEKLFLSDTDHNASNWCGTDQRLEKPLYILRKLVVNAVSGKTLALAERARPFVVKSLKRTNLVHVALVSNILRWPGLTAEDIAEHAIDIGDNGEDELNRFISFLCAVEELRRAVEGGRSTSRKPRCKRVAVDRSRRNECKLVITIGYAIEHGEALRKAHHPGASGTGDLTSAVRKLRKTVPSVEIDVAMSDDCIYRYRFDGVQIQ